MSRPVIFNVDDSENDVLLLRGACRKVGTSFELEVKEDGEKALSYLLAIPQGLARPIFPALMLLDINMPRMNGFEVLAQLQLLAAFPKIPVCIFSSSENGKDVERAYELGALGYVTKPASYQGLLQLVTCLNAGVAESFSAAWMTTLPGFKGPLALPVS